MNKVIAIVAFFAITLSSTQASAQLLSVNNSTVETSSIANTSQKDWSFYTDRDNRILFIDFEKITCNLTGIVVKDKDNKVIFKDDALWQLPVNTIYEVDFSKFATGDYNVELKSFATVIKKSVSIL
jgi:Domain of unknown function (DUF3244)